MIAVGVAGGRQRLACAGAQSWGEDGSANNAWAAWVEAQAQLHAGEIDQAVRAVRQLRSALSQVTICCLAHQVAGMLLDFMCRCVLTALHAGWHAYR